jgi:hypothetical protein
MDINCRRLFSVLQAFFESRCSGELLDATRTVSFTLPTLASLGGLVALYIFNYAGTLAPFGFITPCCLITVAAPVNLKRLGEQRPVDLVMAAGPPLCC